MLNEIFEKVLLAETTEELIFLLNQVVVDSSNDLTSFEKAAQALFRLCTLEAYDLLNLLIIVFKEKQIKLESNEIFIVAWSISKIYDSYSDLEKNIRIQSINLIFSEPYFYSFLKNDREVYDNFISLLNTLFKDKNESFITTKLFNNNWFYLYLKSKNPSFTGQFIREMKSLKSLAIKEKIDFF